MTARKYFTHEERKAHWREQDKINWLKIKEKKKALLEKDPNFCYSDTDHWQQDWFLCNTCSGRYKSDGIKKHFKQKHLH